MPLQHLIPASLSFEDGALDAPARGDGHRAGDAALAHVRQVFLDGNRLPQRWQGRDHFTILDTGFGIGLKFLITWQTWRDCAAAQRPARLHYVAITPHPFTVADLAQLHARWPELGALPALLHAVWPSLTPGFHRLLLDEGRVVLTLVFGDIAACLPQIDAEADAFFLDGFAPDSGSAPGAPDLLARLYRMAAPQATLVASTSAAPVAEALAQAGFACVRQPGFGATPATLAGSYAPRRPLKAHGAHAARNAPQERDAIVIGAGVAGSAACERLAARGWQLTLVERHARPAQEASGNLAGIVMPLPSRDDNLVSRLARAAYLFTLRHWQHLGGIGRAFAGEACGVLQLAQHAEQAAMQRAAISPATRDFADWLDTEAVARRYGVIAPHGAWLFPQGGWVTPASWCEALLAACGDRLKRRFAREALQLQHVDGQWQVCDADGLIAQAPILIFAGGAQAACLPQTAALPLTAIRGQVTHVPAGALPEVPLVICGDGYLTRPAQGLCSVGATYDDDDDPQLRSASQQDNLRRLGQLLPSAAYGGAIPPAAARFTALPLAGRVGFRCVSPDRLPLVGALPDPTAPIAGSRLRDVPRLPGMHGLLAYGSRGLIWASLMAELLASSLEGEPLPIERELAEALDPARFTLKAHRRRG